MNKSIVIMGIVGLTSICITYGYNLYTKEKEIKKINRKLKEIMLRYNGPDKYNREVDNDAVNKMAELAIEKLNINSNTEITDKMFDEIYKNYVDYQIEKIKKIL
jgi:hypothetical protein